MKFPAMPDQIENAAGIREALIEAKALVKHNWYDQAETFTCYALALVESPHKRKAIPLIQDCLEGHQTITIWGIRAGQISDQCSWAEKQAYRHAWLDYMIEELSK